MNSAQLQIQYTLIALYHYATSWVFHTGIDEHKNFEPQLLSEIRNLIKSWEKPCKDLLRDSWFQMLMLVTLLIALYFPDLWVVGDVGDVTSLDVLLGFVMCLFVFEICVQCLGTPGYPYSFFFWMDLMGMLSVLPDFSFIIALTYNTVLVVIFWSSMHRSSYVHWGRWGYELKIPKSQTIRILNRLRTATRRSFW